MTRNLFAEWFHNEFVVEVRTHAQENELIPSAILLIDNASCHHQDSVLQSDDGLIKTVYLPPNCTPLLQPMDQNIIRSVKMSYRKKLIKELAVRENISSNLREINIKDVVFMLQSSWSDLPTSVIETSWKPLLPHIAGNNEFCQEDMIPLAELARNLHGNEDQNLSNIVDNMEMLVDN